ncbi:MAG TPA: 3-phosphoshikimate 1-carboxyvinyltransferase [Bacteroidales bacterium]|nr:3-phosphoshikimate 1-carboxyvinyltransferase [Bacteroidales bacterium]HOK75125.1 3-phosphoshikimate 1-carboxyvinyltransferase [Bacteroidales bacterium]HOM41127.1 3-phosphoshikimate 1-carboxyvinyltransferase [Bacteroidales bacterium]HOU31347.1 3-phosphoshikimate 1-carboxyvinyltransferase [Bacteroidales bacterium]HPP93032.1 3-phosphoshikimate 1-carboxyvinyltransferase [Bacteroidales bacterium]
MKVEASVKEVRGRLRAPSSKSAVQRYIAGALLAEGLSTISVNSMCDDSLAALSVATELGAEATTCGDSIKIKGGFNPKTNKINCGESGLATRMFIPIAAIHNREITVTGRGSLMKRPVKMVEEPLRQLGVQISSKDGYLPVKIKGPLTGGEVHADGSISSQFITGLLMALPVAQKNSCVIVENLVSRPYIDLTIKILQEFDIEIVNDSYRVFSIKGGQKYTPGTFTAEGDWSGAAFLLVMGAIGGKVEVTGLRTDSVQADKAILEPLMMAGASVSVEAGRIKVEKKELNSFEFDISDCPDLAPPLAVLAAACNGKSVLRGAHRLVAKESNRAETITAALNAIGANIKTSGDIIEIYGNKTLSGGESSAYNDHRIAMALATASAISTSPVRIEGMEAINKSYPGFIDDFRKLGGKIKIVK